MKIVSHVIEIAGLRADIQGIELGAQFKDFTASGNPNFTVSCYDQYRLGIKIEDFYDDSQEWNIMIRKHNGVFKVFSTSQKQIEIGKVDIYNKTAVFHNYSDQLQKVLFSPFLRVCFQLFLSSLEGFSIHACGVMVDRKGYLFVGPSGSGKTTLASLRPAKAVLLSDEYICIKKQGEDFYIYSTPWRKAAKGKAKLAKIFFLNKSDESAEIFFKKNRPSSALIQLLPNILYNSIDEHLIEHTFSVLTHMTSQIPAYQMYFPLDKPVWEAMLHLDE